MKNKNIIKTQLETNRIIIRSFTLEDKNDFYEYAKVEGVGERAGWKHHKNIEETETILKILISGGNFYALVWKENNKVIGSFGIETPSYKTVKIGYALSKDYWNLGIMTEVTKHIIDFIFTNSGFNKILVSHFDENTASKKVIEKSGFKYFNRDKCNFPIGEKFTNEYILKKPIFYKIKKKLIKNNFVWLK
ncbi:N-acetyltransferase [Malacoplasma penetrans]|uniref:Acetyltransferase GNAT family n=1 Tax=Malacoplasma penetrans (strain HF-2) TaxID=272633 RepID=Q8EWE6_MALP2|nr:GNAT family N-acetyltransferase [Malacoplasma penetrans]RXY96695.1 N-acetyltransferase [Malacoplasma penetrans]BAC44050.1 acetyltransferase GNAT family [Malacoplasma penetrans HF-2]